MTNTRIIKEALEGMYRYPLRYDEGTKTLTEECPVEINDPKRRCVHHIYSIAVLKDIKWHQGKKLFFLSQPCIFGHYTTATK